MKLCFPPVSEAPVTTGMRPNSSLRDDLGLWKLEAQPKSHVMLIINVIDSPSSLQPHTGSPKFRAV